MLCPDRSGAGAALAVGSRPGTNTNRVFDVYDAFRHRNLGSNPPASLDVIARTGNPGEPVGVAVVITLKGPVPREYVEGLTHALRTSRYVTDVRICG